MTKRLSLPVLLAIFALSLYAQGEKDSIDFTTFKHEIALDFQTPIRNQLSGTTNGSTAVATSLMYRRRIEPKKGKGRALRFQVGGNLNLPVGSQEIFSNGNTGNNNLLVLRNQSVNVFSNFGLEWQRQSERLQFYSGVDIGISYFRELGVSNFSTSSGSIVSYREGKNVVTSFPVIGFFGVKYFFHPRICLSYEASANASFRIRREVIDRFIPSQSEPIEREFNYRRSEVTLLFDYLRYLNLSYFF